MIQRQIKLLRGIACYGFVALLSGCLGGGGDDNAAAPPSSPGVSSLTVQTESGTVKGLTRSVPGTALSADAFLGVPYAAAPRWSAPQKAASWEGIRDVTAFGNQCAPLAGGSEDCLNANIFRPAGAASDAALPVMLYVPGGGNVTTSNRRSDGARLSSTSGIIVVIINHRLGSFGFLNHPAISPAGDGGNFGVQDIKAALEWTKRNIAAFGGNPNKVTLAGQSSGSTNTCRALVDPGFKGLFHATFISSEDCIHDVDNIEQSQTRAVALATKVGCTDTATVAACLRSKTTAELTAAGGAWNPAARLPAVDQIAAGDWNKVPVMLGATRWEGRSAGTAYLNYSEQNYKDWLTRLVGPTNQPMVLAAYPVNKYSGQYAIPYLMGDVITDSGMRGLGGSTNIKLAKIFSHQTPTYFYQFEDPNGTPSTTGGFQNLASHGADPNFWFGELSASFTADQQNLASDMLRYRGEFVKNYNPTVRGLPAWPQMTTANGSVMSFIPGPGMTKDQPVAIIEAQHNFNLWSSIPTVLDRGE
jgi:para-nitrobenzyl esterase